jgi:hypothetical protein
MIPFYIYYSMFGFQRVGDLAWLAGDMRARGFLLGGTAGRTTLNGEGLHHLRYSAERERAKPEQMLKFRLLPLALDVVRKSGTVQEYRTIWQPIGKKGADGMRVGKEILQEQHHFHQCLHRFVHHRRPRHHEEHQLPLDQPDYRPATATASCATS